MNLSIIVIGDEILLGQVTDTNSGFISRKLGQLGFKTTEIRTVSDSSFAIEKAISEALKDNDLVISTGGLGPTKDDITKSVLLKIFGGELYRDSAVTENIKRIFDIKGLNLNALTLDQALVPTTCEVVQNLFGTAPVLWFSTARKAYVALPGVPYETESILSEGSLTEKIKQKFYPDKYYEHHTLTVSGISESALAEKLDDFEKKLGPNFHLAYLPDNGLIYLRLDGEGNDSEKLKRELNHLLIELEETLGSLMIFPEEGCPAEILIQNLRNQGLTLATAESCTGGNIAHLITEVAGCSDVFLGSIVSYANEVKENILGVRKETLETRGSVSEQTVREMVIGAMRVTNATAAIATSGIAGPSGGTPEKPVGTVWIAVAYQSAEMTSPEIHTTCLHIRSKNRSQIITQASRRALLTLNSLPSGHHA